MKQSIFRVGAMGLLVIIALAFTGCATTVSMRYMVPAEINLAPYKNLAITSAEPYRFTAATSPDSVLRDMSGTSPYKVASGFSYGAERQIAQHLTTRVVNDLTRTDYFNLLKPPASDDLGSNLGRFKERGYDGLLTLHITDLRVEEYVYGQEDTVTIPPAVEGEEPTVVKELRHYVMQKVSISVDFMVRDTATGNTVVLKSFSNGQEKTYRIEPDSKGAKEAPNLYAWLSPMVEEFSRSFAQMVAPRWVTKSVALMENKPENPRVEYAFKEAKEGSLQVALDGFLNEWKSSKHVPSGYNAALILESFGRIEEALELIDEVWRYSGNRTVENRKLEMKAAWDAHQKAQQQM